jgi:hypothetical protein
MQKQKLFFIIFLIIFSCTKKQEGINHKPTASFNYFDRLESFIFYSTSSDEDNDSLTYIWKSDWDSIHFTDSHSASPSIVLPVLSESKTINVKLIVSDGNLSDSISKFVELPKSTLERKYGLGRILEASHSNDVSYSWYLDQMNTGIFSGINCGPTSVTMAIKWVNADFTMTPQDARNTYRSSGGWWYTSDIINYLNSFMVNNKIIPIVDVQTLTSELDLGNIAILCLDMYYIRNQVNTKWHIDKFYTASKKGWGHFIVIKGYKVVDNEKFFESYDPYSMGLKYPNDTLKGLNRYYRTEDLDSAVINWWNYAIIVSRSTFKSAGGLDVNSIEDKPGK